MAGVTRADLLGSWLLEQWRIDYPGGRPATFPFGPDATGLLAYMDDGWMSATMCWRARSPLSAASALQADDASKARSYQEYLAYCGRWRLEGSTIVHDVTMSLNPTLIGSVQRRDAQFDGGSLVLSANESAGAAATRVHRIRWRRPS